MGYREITPAELALLQSQSTRGKERFIRFALDHYGPKVHKVRIKVDSEYDDEYYNNKIQRFGVYDAEGNRLTFKLPPKNKLSKFYQEKINNGISLDEDDLEDIAADYYSELEPPGGRQTEEFEEQTVYEYYNGSPLQGKKLFVLEDDILSEAALRG